MRCSLLHCPSTPPPPPYSFWPPALLEALLPEILALLLFTASADSPRRVVPPPLQPLNAHPELRSETPLHDAATANHRPGTASQVALMAGLLEADGGRRGGAAARYHPDDLDIVLANLMARFDGERGDDPAARDDAAGFLLAYGARAPVIAHALPGPGPERPRPADVGGDATACKHNISFLAPSEAFSHRLVWPPPRRHSSCRRRQVAS